MVVGRFFGMEILGVYAVTLSLAVAPISPLMQTVGTLGFLILARNRDTPKRYLETYIWLTWFFAFLAFGFARCSGTVRVRQSLCGGNRYGDPYFRDRVSANSACRRSDRGSRFWPGSFSETYSLWFVYNGQPSRAYQTR